MKPRLRQIFLFLFTGIAGSLIAQHQDCSTAQILCTKDSVVVDNVTGLGMAEDVMTTSCFEDQEHQSHWFKFYATKSGTFEFSIRPDGYLADYDFAMWEGGCPGSPGSTEVACNWLGAVVVPPYFATGVATNPGTSFGEGASLEFINTINIYAGKEYYLLVDNITANGVGFTIFFGGTAEIGNPQLSYTAGVFCNQSSQDLQTVKVAGLDSVPGTEAFFTKYLDAINGTNALTNTVVNSSGNYYVTKTTPHGCKATQTISVTLENPNVLIGDVFTCGNPTVFDFNNLVKKELSGLDLADIDFAFFLNQQDLLNNVNPIGNIVTVSQQIWAKAVTKNGCVDLIPFNVNLQKPVVSLSGSEEICPGKSVYLPISYNGRWPVNITVGINGGTTINDFLIKGEPLVVQPQITTVYTIIACVDTFGCVADLTGSYTVTVHKSPEIVSVLTDCSLYNGVPAFVVTVKGGDTASYQIDGLPGTFTGNVFTSGPLVEGNNYSFQLSDSFKCSVVQWTGEPSCDCDPSFSVNISEQKSLKCFGDTDAELTTVVNGGIAPYKYTWNTGGNGSGLNGLAAGIYSLEVTDANGCTAKASYELTSPPEIVAQYLVTDPVCSGEASGEIEFTAIKGGTQPYTLTLGGTVLTAEPYLFDKLPAGNYTVQVSDASNCIKQYPVKVDDGDAFDLTLGPDITLVDGESADIKVSGDIAEMVSIIWSNNYGFSCDQCTEFAFSPPQNGYFSFTATNGSGCITTDTVNIVIRSKSVGEKVYLPNTFSPDADGVNDLFRPYYGNINVRKSTLSIYNRWGSQLYYEEFTDEAHGWNGRCNGQVMNPDVYVYVLTVELANGDISVFKGDVTIFR